MLVIRNNWWRHTVIRLGLLMCRREMHYANVTKDIAKSRTPKVKIKLYLLFLSLYMVFPHVFNDLEWLSLTHYTAIVWITVFIVNGRVSSRNILYNKS